MTPRKFVFMMWDLTSEAAENACEFERDDGEPWNDIFSEADYDWAMAFWSWIARKIFRLTPQSYTRV